MLQKNMASKLLLKDLSVVMVLMYGYSSKKTLRQKKPEKWHLPSLIRLVKSLIVSPLILLIVFSRCKIVFLKMEWETLY